MWRPSALHADQWVEFHALPAGDCVVQEFQLAYRRRRCEADRCDRSKVITDAYDAVMEVHIGPTCDLHEQTVSILFIFHARVPGTCSVNLRSEVANIHRSSGVGP